MANEAVQNGSPTEKRGGGPKEYPLTDKIRQEAGVKCIYDREGSDTKVVVKFDDGTPLTVDFADEIKCTDIFKRDVKDIGKKPEIAQIIIPVLHSIKAEKMAALEIEQKQRREEEVAAALKAAADNEEAEEEEKEVRKETVCKYSSHPMLRLDESNDVYLYETAIIRGAAGFVGYDRRTRKIVIKKSIKDQWNNLHLSPYQGGSHEPYRFTSEQELQGYIDRVFHITLDEIWDLVHEWVVKCYDTDDEHINNLVTALIIFSYFTDKIGITPYLFLYGESVTGKGAILKIMELLGYRFAGMSLSSAAGIYRLLGDVEAGQVSMFLDEMSYLDRDPILIELLKLGYESSAKIVRNFDVTSAELASQKYFYPFCLKVYAAERLPKAHLVGGFMTRTFFAETFYGVPQLMIKEIAAQPSDPENAKILSEIDDLRKLMFAYRLVHYGDTFPKVESKLYGRHRELTIGNLTLFAGTNKFDIVKRTLYNYIAPQIEAKTDSFTVYMATLIKHLGKVVHDPANKRKLDSLLLDEFEKSFNEEMQQLQKAEESDETFYTLPTPATEYFDIVTLESDLIWEAIKRVLPGAEEVSYTYSSSDREDEDDNTSNNKKKNRKSNSNSNTTTKSSSSSTGRKVIRSNLFYEVSWSNSLPRALRVMGGKPERQKHAGRRVWIMSGTKIARFERSYSQSLQEISSIKKSKKKDRERFGVDGGDGVTLSTRQPPKFR